VDGTLSSTPPRAWDYISGCEGKSGGVRSSRLQKVVVEIYINGKS